MKHGQDARATPVGKGFCKTLDLYEVKAKSGPRVIFFYDQDHIVICSHAFNKQSQKTPSKEIKKAREWKRKYFERKASGQGFVIYMEKEQAAPRRQP